METTILSPSLVALLERRGYIYFLGKTENVPNDSLSHIETRIVLTPVKNNPETDGLPNGYDSWYNILNGDAMDMANGVDATEFFVNVP